MGLNSSAEKVLKTPCADAQQPPKTALDDSLVTKAATTIKIDGEGMMGKTSKCTDGDGSLLFSGSSSVGMGSAAFVFTSPANGELCTVAGKAGLTKGSASITKGGVEAGTIELSKGLTTAKATYSVGGEPVYTAEKYTTIFFLLTVLDSDGNMVAKVNQPGMNNKKLVVELGAGVDILAVAALASCVGVASGSAVGGLAGAGVI